MNKRNMRRRHSGQTLIIIAGAIVALIALVALAVDGGNAYSQRRIAQNAVDGAATSGTVKMQTNFLANSYTDPSTGVSKVYPMTSTQDRQVLAAIITSLQAVGADTTSVQSGGTMDARYVDNNGNLYGSPVGTNNSVPFADGNGPGSPGAAGVWVSTTKSADTYFARLIGINKVSADAHGTAQLGSSVGCTNCNSNNSNGPIVWPITIFMSAVNLNGGDTTLYDFGNTYSPGNWGDFQWSTSNGNSHNCTNGADSFYCMMAQGFDLTNPVSPLNVYQENADGSRSDNLVPRTMIPIGWDGVHPNSHGFWGNAFPGNRLSSYHDLATDAANGRRVMIPISDQVIGQGNTTYYHVVNMGLFQLTAGGTSGSHNFIRGQFIGFGWNAGQMKFTPSLRQAVINHQTVIRIGP